MLRLAVRASEDVVGQHREVIRDDQIVLLIDPWLARHWARLLTSRPFVIKSQRTIGSLNPSITTGCARLPSNMPTACFPGGHANRKNAPLNPLSSDLRNPLETLAFAKPNRAGRGSLG